MPRRRYYYRSRRTKPKWSFLTQDINSQQVGVPTGQFGIFGVVVCGNPSNDLVVAQPVIKTARFRLRGALVSALEQPVFAAKVSFIFALMYVPEGITTNVAYANLNTIGNCLFYAHPEWVMGWTRYDFINPAQRNEFSITSRLKRNLNKGDSIQLIVICLNNSSGASGGYNVSATVSYACRAN